MIYKLLLTLISLSIFISCADNEQNNSHLNLEETIEGYVENNFEDNEAGISVRLIQSGKSDFSYSKGLARIDGKISIDENTQFRTASITKPFTALAILKLVEDGRLTVDDKISSYLTPLPSSYSDITVEHLLTHTSGILDYITDNNDLSSLDNLTTSNVLELIDNSGLENLSFAPGTKGDYSNTGYVLLALIIEEITNTSFPLHMKEEFFDPLGMTNSFVISEDTHLGDFGENYALSYGYDLNVLGFNSLIYGANGIVSTINDLTKFTEALINHQIVKKETLALMTTTHSSIEGISDYGYGWLTSTGVYWHTGKHTGRNDYFHSGGYDGYKTLLYISHDLNFQVIILTNNGATSEQHMWRLQTEIRNYIKGEN
ncbi:MAG: beta-lactamase family protein [Balneolaceae bacterium]|nr:beta-lactamase family protein [Balneolaceae bacterium]